MPFKDPAARAAYMREYWSRYLPRKDAEAGTKANAARKRKAAWYQANKARLTAKKRRQRRAAATAERMGVAVEIVTGCDMSHPGATRRTEPSRRKAA